MPSESVAHAKWGCEYQFVWVPKHSRKALYDELRKHLNNPVLRELAWQRECAVEEGHLRLVHVHMLFSFPPKYAVGPAIRFINWKSAIHIARNCLGPQQSFTGQHFWARWYYISTAGRDGATIRQYIQKQEADDQRFDQFRIFAR